MSPPLGNREVVFAFLILLFDLSFRFRTFCDCRFHVEPSLFAYSSQARSAPSCRKYYGGDRRRKQEEKTHEARLVKRETSENAGPALTLFDYVYVLGNTEKSIVGHGAVVYGVVMIERLLRCAKGNQ